MTLTKPDHPPLTTQALVNWLRTQPPELTYIWSDPVHCLVGHYLADNHSAWGTVAYSDLPDYVTIAKTEPHTFGAALARAEALLALPPPAANTYPPHPPQPFPELELQAEPVREPAALPAPEPVAS